MTISDVRIRKVEKDGNPVKAYASITLDGEFVVHEVKVIQNDDGSLYVVMPANKDKNNKFRDIAHPLNQEMRNKIEEAVLTVYQQN